MEFYAAIQRINMYYNTFIIFIFYHLNSNLVRKKNKKGRLMRVFVLHLYQSDLMCKDVPSCGKLMQHVVMYRESKARSDKLHTHCSSEVKW